MRTKTQCDGLAEINEIEDFNYYIKYKSDQTKNSTSAPRIPKNKQERRVFEFDT